LFQHFLLKEGHPDLAPGETVPHPVSTVSFGDPSAYQTKDPKAHSYCGIASHK